MPKFHRKTEIDAPVEKVWEAMINPAYWPQWFPGVKTVSNVTQVGAGGSFDWTDEGRTGSARIGKFVPMKQLEILTQIGDDRDSHVFKLRPSGGLLGLGADECQVDYTLDTLMGGGILGSFIAGGNPKDALQVKKTLHQLRRLVEGL